MRSGFGLGVSCVQPNESQLGSKSGDGVGFVSPHDHGMFYQCGQHTSWLSHCVAYVLDHHGLARVIFFVWPRKKNAASGADGTAEASEGDEHDLDVENEDVEHTVPEQVLHRQGV